jgi:DNA polymerase III epsilon subunit-like protein
MERNPACVFFDLETGGLSYDSPIIEYAGVAVDMKEWKELESFETKIQFDPKSCDPTALRINNYKEEDWKGSIDEEKFLQIHTSFLNRYADVRQISRAGRPYFVTNVGGHNVASFDVDRLSRLYKRRGKFLPIFFSGSLDTLRLAAWAFLHADKKPEKYNLMALCDFFEYEWTGKAHTALADVRATIFIAQRLLEIIREKPNAK